MRAEVGLLTRNIKIRGVQDAKSAEQEHGVHIMMFGIDKELSTGRFESVEIFNAGQAFAMGRYPIHFHRVGNVRNSYVKGCAIHHSHNRAITIHSVHHLLV
jgi:hypothetical protein